jgi:hypothetical protein
MQTVKISTPKTKIKTFCGEERMLQKKITIKHFETNKALSYSGCDVAFGYGHHLRRCIQKFPDWPPGARTANGIALCY